MRRLYAGDGRWAGAAGGRKSRLGFRPTSGDPRGGLRLKTVVRPPGGGREATQTPRPKRVPRLGHASSRGSFQGGERAAPRPAGIGGNHSHHGVGSGVKGIRRRQRRSGAVSGVKGVRVFHRALEAEEATPAPARRRRVPAGWHLAVGTSSPFSRRSQPVRTASLSRRIRYEPKRRIPRRWNGECFRGSEKGPAAC